MPQSLDLSQFAEQCPAPRDKRALVGLLQNDALRDGWQLRVSLSPKQSLDLGERSRIQIAHRLTKSLALRDERALVGFRRWLLIGRLISTNDFGQYGGRRGWRGA